MTSLPLSQLDLLHITHARHLLILTASVMKRSSIKRKIEKRGRRRERKRDPALMTAYESVSGHNLITSETDWTLQSTASTFDLCLCLFQKPTHSFIKHHFPSEDLLLKIFMKCNMAWGLRHTNTTHIRASRLTLLSQWEAGRESVYLGLWDYQWANYLWSSRGSLADCARLPGMEDSLSRAWERWEKWGTNDCTLFWCTVCSLFLTAHYWYFFLIWGPSSFPLGSQCECFVWEWWLMLKEAESSSPRRIRLTTNPSLLCPEDFSSSCIHDSPDLPAAQIWTVLLLGIAGASHVTR